MNDYAEDVQLLHLAWIMCGGPKPAELRHMTDTTHSIVWIGRYLLRRAQYSTIYCCSHLTYREETP